MSEQSATFRRRKRSTFACAAGKATTILLKKFAICLAL